MMTYRKTIDKMFMEFEKQLQEDGPLTSEEASYIAKRARMLMVAARFLEAVLKGLENEFEQSEKDYQEIEEAEKGIWARMERARSRRHNPELN